MNIEVQYREEESLDGVPVAEIPMRREAIDSVIPLIQSWGLTRDYGDGITTINENNLFGQFRVLDDRVIFEVVNPA